MERTKMAILLTESPSIRKNCGQGIDSYAALVRCVDLTYRSLLESDALRDALARELANDDAPVARPAATPKLQPKADAPRTPAAVEPERSNDSDNVYCLFVAHRIREGDLAYSRAEQVPTECRSIAEVREALEAAQHTNPAFPISGLETDKSIACLMGEVTPFTIIKNKDGTERKDLLPC